MDNTVTQDDDDGGKIMLLSNNLFCASRKYPYPPLFLEILLGSGETLYVFVI